MINTQIYITTKLKETLEKMIILPKKRLTNIVFIIIGIINSKSVVISNKAEELKDDYSKGTEASKIKRIDRFFSNKLFNPETVYYMFTCELIAKYAETTTNNTEYIILDHTTIKDKFTILMFSLKVGKRSIPL
jgi:hypothetical protein